jgi:hypothetical protein
MGNPPNDDELQRLIVLARAQELVITAVLVLVIVFVIVLTMALLW